MGGSCPEAGKLVDNRKGAWVGGRLRKEPGRTVSFSNSPPSSLQGWKAACRPENTRKDAAVHRPRGGETTAKRQLQKSHNFFSQAL